MTNWFIHFWGSTNSIKFFCFILFSSIFFIIFLYKCRLTDLSNHGDEQSLSLWAEVLCWLEYSDSRNRHDCPLLDDPSLWLFDENCWGSDQLSNLLAYSPLKYLLKRVDSFCFCSVSKSNLTLSLFFGLDINLLKLSFTGYKNYWFTNKRWEWKTITVACLEMT